MTTTHIVAILDCSGSMGLLATEVISNFNKFLKEQQKLAGKAKLTLVIFDNIVTTIYDKVKLKDAKPITNKEYVIGGMTALNDAIGHTLHRFMKKEKAIFLIHTDGMENASKEYTKTQVKQMVESKDNFEFIFVGAGIDAQGTGSNLGFVNNITTTRSIDDLAATYNSFSETTLSYRCSKS